jgi:lysine-specific histone demethylase 1
MQGCPTGQQAVLDLSLAAAAAAAAAYQAADGSIAAVADLGGSIITGIDGNPLAVIAKQLDVPLHDINSSDVPLYLRDGSQLNSTIDMQVRLAG